MMEESGEVGRWGGGEVGEQESLCYATALHVCMRGFPQRCAFSLVVEFGGWCVGYVRYVGLMDGVGS